jgi:hypothetical protein
MKEDTSAVHGGSKAVPALFEPAFLVKRSRKMVLPSGSLPEEAKNWGWYRHEPWILYSWPLKFLSRNQPEFPAPGDSGLGDGNPKTDLAAKGRLLGHYMNAPSII